MEEPVPVGRIGEIGFAAGSCWQLALPGDRSPRLFTSADGAQWSALPEAPLGGPVHDAAVGLFPDSGLATIVENVSFHFHGSGQDAWSSLALPEGAVWVSPASDGGWWAVGSQPSKRIRTSEREAALWCLSANSAKWYPVTIRASWWDAYRAIRDGGFEQLRAVDANGSPAVLAGQCAAFLDDPSWFVFTAKRSGHFAIQRLRNRSLARIVRDARSRPVLITTDGELWDWNGRRWKARNSAHALRRLLGDAAISAVHLSFADEEVFGVIIRPANAGQERRTAVVSADGGRTWRVEDKECDRHGIPIAAWASPGTAESKRLLP
ncbi:MAG: hypothetical protein IIA92_04375 [Chloroflexi bacterium]|nr:hypothetical protein [Chloroflexota bacterium]